MNFTHALSPPAPLSVSVPPSVSLSLSHTHTCCHSLPAKFPIPSPLPTMGKVGKSDRESGCILKSQGSPLPMLSCTDFPGVGWLGSPLEQTDGWAQANSSPHLCLSFTLLQTCESLCLSLCGHPLTTLSRSASPTGSPCATWTDTGTVMNPPMASTE